MVNSLLISAGAVPVISILVEQRVYIALLLLPIALLSAAWLFQYHLYALYIAGTYLRQILIPKVEAIARPSDSNLSSRRRIWEFEFVTSAKMVRSWKKLMLQGLGSFSMGATVLLLVLPSIISLGVFWTTESNTLWEWWEISLFILDIMLMIGVMGFSVLSPYLAKQYFEEAARIKQTDE